jgi:hypothetical protein
MSETKSRRKKYSDEDVELIIEHLDQLPKKNLYSLEKFIHRIEPQLTDTMKNKGYSYKDLAGIFPVLFDIQISEGSLKRYMTSAPKSTPDPNATPPSQSSKNRDDFGDDSPPPQSPNNADADKGDEGSRNQDGNGDQENIENTATKAPSKNGNNSGDDFTPPLNLNNADIEKEMEDQEAKSNHLSRQLEAGNKRSSNIDSNELESTQNAMKEHDSDEVRSGKKSLMDSTNAEQREVPTGTSDPSNPVLVRPPLKHLET